MIQCTNDEKMKRDVMDAWKEFNPKATKSIREDINWPYEDLDKVVKYLENGRKGPIAAMSRQDVISGKLLPGSYAIMSDDEWVWPNTLPYYVKQYRLRLPDELINKIYSGG